MKTLDKLNNMESIIALLRHETGGVNPIHEVEADDVILSLLNGSTSGQRTSFWPLLGQTLEQLWGRDDEAAAEALVRGCRVYTRVDQKERFNKAQGKQLGKALSKGIKTPAEDAPEWSWERYTAVLNVLSEVGHGNKTFWLGQTEVLLQGSIQALALHAAWLGLMPVSKEGERPFQEAMKVLALSQAPFRELVRDSLVHMEEQAGRNCCKQLETLKFEIVSSTSVQYEDEERALAPIEKAMAGMSCSSERHISPRWHASSALAEAA